MLIKFALSLLGATLLLVAAPPAPFTYSQDFNGMRDGTSAPDGWTVYAISGSHDRFKPLDDTLGIGGLPTGDDIKGGSEQEVLIPATPDTSASQKGRSGFNWAIGGSATERSLGTSPSGVAAVVLELKLTNGGPATKHLDVAYDVRVLSTTVVGNKGYATSGYDGIEELPGYRLYYSLDNGATYTNIASLNSDGHQWPNTIRTVHLAAPDVALNGSWNANAVLFLRWVDDNAQSPSPDQKLGLDNLTIRALP